MVTPPDETTADPYAVIAALRQQLAERSAERDVALAEKAALAEALTTRNSEYGERIEHQSATIDVLKAMSASPGDPQPVFDLITNRVVELCNGMGSWLSNTMGKWFMRDRLMVSSITKALRQLTQPYFRVCQRVTSLPVGQF